MLNKISMKKNSIFIFLFFFSIFFSQTKSIDGEYKISCQNKYQIFDINKNKAYVSLYNNIYINGIIKKGLKSNTYDIFYKYVEPIPKFEKKFFDSINISKTIPFATIKKVKNGIIVNWKGMYNNSIKKREFVKEAIFVEDNDNHDTTIFLKKCQ